MAGVLLDMAISQDGFVGVPGDADPGLYDWYFDPSEASRPVVDELQLHVVPVLLGSGIPLFDGFGAALRLRKLRVVDAPNVTHLRYRVER